MVQFPVRNPVSNFRPFLQSYFPVKNLDNVIISHTQMFSNYPRINLVKNKTTDPIVNNSKN